mmetsp:Transcript_11139/g.26766  ORF Transcript_11139/g.26766 Transcript_11139/m.26766 type:complete len:482 (+) Transcript_11139:52-1497(+)
MPYRPLALSFPQAIGDVVIEERLWMDHYTDSDDDLGTVMNGDKMEVFDHPMIENMSHQYSSEFLKLGACYSDDKPLWWLVLRWMKMMFLEIARSYYAKPLLLVCAPMLFGIVLGVWIGRWRPQSQFMLPERPQQSSTKKIQQVHYKERIHQLAIRKLVTLLRASWYSLVLYFDFNTERNVTTIPRGENVRDDMNTGPVMESQNTFLSECGKEYRIENERIGLSVRENETRNLLKSEDGSTRQSDVPANRVPRHVAVIMDGNRRFGKSKYGSAAKGHWDGSSKLVEFAKWCIAERIAVLTVFAFSSENWKRDPSEVASLMQIFAKYCDELRVEATERNIKIKVLTTDHAKIPSNVQIGIKKMIKETKHCDGMIMNICLSYGSRGEIVRATKSVIEDVLKDKLNPININEKTIGERLLTHQCGGDPDVLIRTSGELRISNFLLWQLAYTELFFVDKPWPAIEKDDLLQVIRSYAKSRNRRYGK